MAKNIEIIFYWVQGGLSLMWFFDNCIAAVADFEISRLVSDRSGNVKFWPGDIRIQDPLPR